MGFVVVPWRTEKFIRNSGNLEASTGFSFPRLCCGSPPTQACGVRLASRTLAPFSRRPPDTAASRAGLRARAGLVNCSPVNLRHLARLAKLSPSAVSLALRGSTKVSAATRARVRELADRHGYRPDARIVEMMSHLRKPHTVRQQACFAVISLYDNPHPWE